MKLKAIVVIVFLLIGTSALLALPKRNSGEHERGNLAGQQGEVMKKDVVELAENSTSTWDCLVDHEKDNTARLPAVRRMFKVGHSSSVRSKEGWFTAGFWSPTGNQIVFVSPTEEIIQFNEDKSRDSDGEIPLGTSRNQLWIYSVPDDSLRLVTENGSNPRFSKEGEGLYFISSSSLQYLNLRDWSIGAVGVSGDNTAKSLLFSQPLRDGGLLTFSDKGAGLMRLDLNAKRSYRPIEIGFSDRLYPSPTDEYLAISYGSSQIEGVLSPVLVVLDQSGNATPVLKNCPFAASEATWSSDGRSIAYPLKGEMSEIQTFDIPQKARKSILSLPGIGRISGLSFSPDSRYLAYTDEGLGQAKATIWITAMNGSGRQEIVAGEMARWSPDGTRLLYAVRGANQSLGWHIVNVTPLAQ
jgi:Tol biopolymer transport system component